MSGLVADSPAIPGVEGASTPDENAFGDPDGLTVFEFDLPQQTPMIPEGEYLCYVGSIKPDRSRKGNPMIVVEWTIAEGDYEGKNAGRTYLTLTEKAMFKVTEFCEATGLGEAGGSARFTPEDALYRLATVEVVHNESEADGKTRIFANPGSILPPPQGPGAEYQAPQEGIPG